MLYKQVWTSAVQAYVGHTNKCSSNAHNSVSGVQHAGVLAAVLHAAVDAGEDGVAGVDKGAEAKGDGQAVQVHREGLGHMDAALNKIVYYDTCSNSSSVKPSTTSYTKTNVQQQHE